jgi:hypothetical protein
MEEPMLNLCLRTVPTPEDDDALVFDFLDGRRVVLRFRERRDSRVIVDVDADESVEVNRGRVFRSRYPGEALKARRPSLTGVSR